jgi:hypothetical protein
MTLADGDTLRGGTERNKGMDVLLSTKTKNRSTRDKSEHYEPLG